MINLWQKRMKINMDFKNSCMVESYDRSDFLDANFFCLGHFLIIFSKMMDQKETPAKKDSKMKNYFFHARQPRAKFFYFCAQQNCILTFLYRGAIIYESPCRIKSKCTRNSHLFPRCTAYMWKKQPDLKKPIGLKNKITGWKK